MKYGTRRQIVSAIKKRYNKREPLNISAVREDDPELLDAAYAVEPFLGWKQAIDLAGLDYRAIAKRYVEEIPCRICGEYFVLLNTHLIVNHSISPEEYLEEFPDAELSSESFRFRRGKTKKKSPEYLPDWEPALSHEYCLDKIYAYFKSGTKINYTNLVFIDPGIILKLTNELGIQWDEVLEMLGLDARGHRLVVREDDFTIEDFREWLEDRERRGLKNTYLEVAELEQEFDNGSAELNCRIVAWAMAYHNRSWSTALNAAGIDWEHPSYNVRNFPDEESLLQAIRDIESAGRPTAYGDVVRNPEDAKVAWGAARYFPNWTLALQAAGVIAKSKSSRYDSKADFDQDLKKRIANRLPLDPVEVYLGGRSDVKLFRVATKFYPSWSAAVRAVSNNDQILVKQAEGKNNPFSTKAKVKAELKSLHKNGELVAERKMPNNKRNRYLRAMAHCFFGGWGKAATAAGIDRREYHEWNRNSPAFYRTKEEVIEGIRWRHGEGYQMNARALATGDEMDAPLITSARKLFGNWQNAIEAAGLDYTEFVRKKQDYSIKKVHKQYPTKEDVIAGIKQRIKEGKKLNVRSMKHGDDRDHPLSRSANDLFGSWDNALKAAGQDPNKIRRKKQDYSKLKQSYASYESKEEVLDEIKARLKKGQALNPKNLQHGDDEERDFALWKTGRQLFGTWEDALEAAGVDLLTVFPEWQLKRMENYRKKRQTKKK